MQAATASELARLKRMAVEMTTVMATGVMALRAPPVTAATATTKAPETAERIHAVQRLVTPSRASLVVLKNASRA